MSKIGIDIRCLVDGKRTGVEEYTLGLLEQVFEMDQKNKYILFLNSWKPPKFNLKIFEKYPNVKIKQFRVPNKILNFCFWYLGWPKVDKMLGGIDVFFMPNINFVALSKKVKLILTIHDLSFERFPEMFSLKRRLWHAIINPKKLCQRADAVIAVSDSTKEDIVELYRIDSEKVHRIYNSVSDECQMIDRNEPNLLEVKEKYRLPYAFILFLGTIEPRKNVIAIARAFDKLKSLNNPQLEKYKLVIAGGKGWSTKPIFEELRSCKHTDDIIYIGRIDDADKPALYNLASLFVYPSYYEGFGMPVLEAMKCSVPVVASHTSSLGEIVAEAGILVHPEKPQELFDSIKEVLLNRDLSDRLKLSGLRRACMFSWRASAKEFLETVRSLMQ